ncbi:MAG: aminotransferase class V-fold PLP-dependent enzyme [Oscillospiraceae bacterium]|nr:aminotransferase class V-fold PLP-dependent enzyme [Oscillospiraceae bacterium]
MTQPICRFVQEYNDAAPLRLHMPGHKGKSLLGPEALDITEIRGADVLYNRDDKGIIRQSEEIAGKLFGTAKTLYSTEGSSLCIRAMVYLASLYAQKRNRPKKILAGRNAHKVFLSACALLDVAIEWVYPDETESILSGRISPARLDEMLEREAVAAVYLTSPDYLGNLINITEISKICRRRKVLLLVDHAHGAYRKFLPISSHPMDLGVDLCCDSAHKTLPVLTGGAYLHFSASCPMELQAAGERAMTLFASTSPSYLILQSLDAANGLLAGSFSQKLEETVKRLDALKDELKNEGWRLAGEEELKLTLLPKERGMTGEEAAQALEEQQIFCEFADPDTMVMMFSACNEPEDFVRLHKALHSLPIRKAIADKPPHISTSPVVMTPRQAMLSPAESLPLQACIGRILASPSVSCPPAVPILVCGERITEEAIALFEYYGIRQCDVVAEPFS